MKASKTSKILKNRDDFADDTSSNRRVVCRRCHVVMVDCENAKAFGEFWHPSKLMNGKPDYCQNSGLCFRGNDSEVEPFIRKRFRRAYKRLGVRV